MHYCESCGRLRRHAHSPNAKIVYSFCQRCRKRGHLDFDCCGWCGDSRGRCNGWFDSNNRPVPDDEQNVEQVNDEQYLEQDNGEGFEDDMGTTAVATEDPRTHPADSRSLAESTRWTRRQCQDCYAAFDFVSDYEQHLQDNELVCEEHKACLGRKDIWDHAMAEGHTKCFLSTCTSKYRDPRWNYEVKDLENHIWWDHVKPSAGHRPITRQGHHTQHGTWDNTRSMPAPLGECIWSRLTGK